METPFSRGASPISITAALAVAALLIAAGVELGTRIRPATTASGDPGPAGRKDAASSSSPFVLDKDGDGTPDWQDALARAGIATSSAYTTDVVSMDPFARLTDSLGTTLASGYLALKEYGAYTPERANRLGDSVASSIPTMSGFVAHTEEELAFDDDTSDARILSYRADMREALAGIVSTNEPEFATFARFIETGRQRYLDDLAKRAAAYRNAELATRAVVVPQNAREEHLRAVNALGAYADSLEQLIRRANDPLALLTLLRTYNESEREMLYAFDALSAYYVRSIESD